MRTFALLLLICSCAAGGVDALNGRWNIKVENDPRHRAWWLEVSGAGGTGPLKGRFVGFPGGDMAELPSPNVSPLQPDGDALTFTCTRNNRNMQYRVRVVNGRLEGTLTENGKVTRFHGQRAPVIRDKDDGTWVPGKPVALFNGRDLRGWTAIEDRRELGWTVKDGILTNVAGANNIASVKKFWNFILEAEYRMGADTNSGIGLRGRYEIQIYQDHGQPPSIGGHGALYSRIAPRVNATRPPGEWQQMKVRLVGRDLTVELNGQLLMDKVEVEGLTAMATDADEALPGPITLQGDHRVVEIRKLVVTPLNKRRP